MIPTVAQVCSAFRVHLGDTEVPAGQIWTNASGKCDPYIQQAYSELYKGMESGAVRNVFRTLYGNLPAYTSYINPATFGATNFSEPVEKPLFERDSSGTVAITNAVPNTATPGAPYVRITAAGHGFSNGQMALIFGIVGLSDDVNDQWSVTVFDANTFDLMGCTATGTYVSGGAATTSTANWSEVHSVPQVENYPQTPGGCISQYAWIGNAFRVTPATTVRQIKMIFYLSGQAPSSVTNPSASLGFDDCLGFLAYRAAALAVSDRVNAGPKYTMLNTTALGPTQNHNDWGGLYGLLMRSKARSAARNRVVLGTYRDPRRNAGWIYRY
jgi:hypothetical protein